MHRWVIFFAFAGAVWAQTPDTAAIHGHVTDQTHAALAGVRIVVKNSLGGPDRTAETDGSGDFSVTGLPISGTYTILAEKAGFAGARIGDLTLAGGVGAEVNLEMNVAGAQTQVTVTGVAGEVRADSPQLGDAISAQQAEEMPLLNKRITYLPLLNAANRPAINQGDVFMNENLFTTNGAGRRQAWFEVDGATGNDSWGRQTIFSNIPVAAVQEMTILENAFSAEYGGSAGSAVNIITKSGGNQWHGQAGEVWRPAATKRSWPDSRPPTRRAETTSPATRWGSRRCRWAVPPVRRRTFSRRGSSAARTAPRRSFRRLPRAVLSAITGDGSRISGWIIRSTTATAFFIEAMWTGFTTPIPTERWEATICRTWIEFFTGGRIRMRSARRRCFRRRC